MDLNVVAWRDVKYTLSLSAFRFVSLRRHQSGRRTSLFCWSFAGRRPQAVCAGALISGIAGHFLKPKEGRMGMRAVSTAFQFAVETTCCYNSDTTYPPRVRPLYEKVGMKCGCHRNKHPVRFKIFITVAASFESPARRLCGLRASLDAESQPCTDWPMLTQPDFNLEMDADNEANDVIAMWEGETYQGRKRSSNAGEPLDGRITRRGHSPGPPT